LIPDSGSKKGSFCTCCTWESERRGTRELFIPGSENYAKREASVLAVLGRGRREERGNFSSLIVKTEQKGKLLYLQYLGEGEERNEGTFHL
jgi:hypothetical protein